MAEKSGKKSKSKSTELKVKKKRWVQIICPLFNNQMVGETSVVDIKSAIGKNISVNLMMLTNDPRKQNSNIMMRVEQLKGETGAIAEVKGYEMQQPSLRKLVRRGKTKVQDSFKCYTSDKKPIVVKPFVLTRFIVKKEVARKIRYTLKQTVLEYVSKNTFDALLKDVISSKLQKHLKISTEKIYPIKMVEFSVVKILSNTQGSFEKFVPKQDKKSKSEEEDSSEEEQEQTQEEKKPSEQENQGN
jgi:ribosomal protein S3AE